MWTTSWIRESGLRRDLLLQHERFAASLARLWLPSTAFHPQARTHTTAPYSPFPSSLSPLAIPLVFCHNYQTCYAP